VNVSYTLEITLPLNEPVVIPIEPDTLKLPVNCAPFCVFTLK
jgi:hypothetical protein